MVDILLNVSSAMTVNLLAISACQPDPLPEPSPTCFQSRFPWHWYLVPRRYANTLLTSIIINQRHGSGAAPCILPLPIWQEQNGCCPLVGDELGLDGVGPLPPELRSLQVDPNRQFRNTPFEGMPNSNRFR
jgi:hypothetical protein